MQRLHSKCEICPTAQPFMSCHLTAWRRADVTVHPFTSPPPATRRGPHLATDVYILGRNSCQMDDLIPRGSYEARVLSHRPSHAQSARARLRDPTTAT